MLGSVPIPENVPLADNTITVQCSNIRLRREYYVGIENVNESARSVGLRRPSAGGDERLTISKKRDFAAPLHGFVIC